MTTNDPRAEEARARAEARFQKTEQRKTDAEKVLAEVAAEREAEAAKTLRLRALRLAKEEAERSAGETPKKLKPRRT